MNHNLYLIDILIFALSCSDNNSTSNKPSGIPKIAIAGIAIESSTFSPAQTHEEAFHAKTGIDVFNIYPFFKNLINKLYYDIFMEIENPNRRVGMAILFTVIPIILLRIISWFTPIPNFMPNIFSIAWPIFILFIPTIVDEM